MTGELFAAIRGHTLFAQLIPRETNSTVFRESAFDSGLQRSATPHGLLNALFELRAAVLLEHISVGDLADMISGLLIGTEIRHVQTLIAAGKNIAVLGAAGISERYVRALQSFSFEPRALAVQEVTARGFAALFRATVVATPAQ